MLRTKKVVNGVTTEYDLNGSTILTQITGNDRLNFLYDDAGSLLGLKWNGTEYWYVKNLQGDIIGILDSDGTKVVNYVYDAWGQVSLGGTPWNWVALGELNPFRYRGYYFDTESGLYYVSSRYYDPVVGRFINADTADVLTAALKEPTDKNLFAYCDNNPVVRKDTDGEFWDTVFDVISLVGSIAEVVVNPANPMAWASLAADAVCLVTPGLTGGGALVKVLSKADNVVDTAKTIYKAADKASDIRKATESYEILYKSGKNYVGKGGFKRAIKSASKRRYIDDTLDTVTSIKWKKAPDIRSAFIDEYQRMYRVGVKNANTYNKIWSPGKKYYENAFYQLLRK